MAGSDHVSKREAATALDRVEGGPSGLLQRADALRARGRWVEAEQLCVAAAATTDPRILKAAGVILSHCERHTRALACFTEAARRAPSDPELAFNLAAEFRMSGRLDEARQAVDRALALRVDDAAARFLLSDLRKATVRDNQVAELERIRRAATGPTTAMLHYALGKELSDLGQHDAAFAAFADGAGYLRSQLPLYNVNDDIRRIAAIAARHTRDTIRAHENHDQRAAPVFIAGLPRTGTTLVERLLLASGVYQSTGEVTAFESAIQRAQAHGESLGADPVRVASGYVEQIRNLFAPEGVWIDKCPGNFLYFGLAAAALPRARMVLLMRDPLDTCVSLYTTFFGGLYPYSWDLESVGRYWRAFEKLVEHWSREIDPARLLIVHYERLVRAPLEESQRLYAFLGLNWSARVVDPSAVGGTTVSASAVQVHREIFTTSVGKWKRYAALLEPLQSALTVPSGGDNDERRR